MITVKDLKEFLDYSPDTGVITWKYRDVKWFKDRRSQRSWNTRFAGKEAGTTDKFGYVLLNLYSKGYKAHRVAWAIYYGKWPDGCIDHINGLTSDNRISNLREVSNRDNLKNSKKPFTNRSGHVGVIWNKKLSKWQAYIGGRGDRKHLGYFKNKQEAIDVRKQAELEYGYHENHGR